MKRTCAIGGILLGLAAVLAVTSTYGDDRTFRRASLATVEGLVRSIDRWPGEGGGDVEVVRILVDETPQRELSVALAPGETLRQIEFEVQVGDRLKVRVFLSEDPPSLAHKVLNVTRGTMVRLRTLSRIPLWDGNGHWQGGPCRNRGGGPHGPGLRHRGIAPRGGS